VRRFFKYQVTLFLLAFVAVFVIYLFIKFDANEVIQGMILSAVAGLVVSLGVQVGQSYQRRAKAKAVVGNRQ
jgi:multisubunit Na+/H+ antiporter MnhE subunit